MGCYNSTVVKAPIGKVWPVLSNFHDLSWATGVISSTKAVGKAAPNQIGAKRVLNDAFHETLLAIDEADHSFRYSIDDGPEAVSRNNVQGYIGAVRLRPVTDGNATFVEWSSSWENSGGGVAEFCNPIYRALLGALKKHFE